MPTQPEPKSQPREDQPPAPPEELSYSRDATHSSYAQAAEPKDAPSNPPNGPQVEQTLGKPTEAS